MKVLTCSNQTRHPGTSFQSIGRAVCHSCVEREMKTATAPIRNHVLDLQSRITAFVDTVKELPPELQAVFRRKYEGRPFEPYSDDGMTS
jgi:guanyl-specific ribonuclease Sa